MTFDEAYNELMQLYPGDYKCLRYERNVYGDGTIGNAEIGAYAASKGWSGPHKNFRNALTALAAKEDKDPKITDDKDEDDDNI
jgi:hypothetical protein